jgi:hypothetical protein
METYTTKVKGTRMSKRIIFTVVVIIGMISLAACSAISSIIGQKANPAAQTTPNAFDIANLPLESKLAMGTLQLEDTDKAVTPDEAKNLITLWKALKSFSSSQTVSKEEINALYQQIEDTMTPEQLQAIKDMEFTRESMSALQEKYGSQMGGGNNELGNLTESQRATRIAQFTNREEGFGEMGGGPDGPGDMRGAGGPGFQSSSGNSTQSTPYAQSAALQLLGMNRMYLDPLIKLLEERAAQ